MNSVIITLLGRTAWMAALLTLFPPGAVGAPFRLANYRFDGNANDDTGNSPPILLLNTTFTNNALVLDASGTNLPVAEAHVNGSA